MQLPYLDGPRVRAANIDPVRFEFYKNYPATGETSQARADARQKAFKRALDEADHRNLVRTREIGDIVWVWLCEANEPPTNTHDEEES